MSTFNKNAVDHLKQPMFFGEELNTARYDVMKYPKFDDFTTQQLSYFWRPEEVSLSDDINDFKNKMNPTEQRIYILNLQYQTLLDSVQGRSPNLALLPIVSIPELETWIETWSFSETIHSRSYTHIIRNVFDNPTKVIDDIMLTPEITERAGMVTDAYDKLIALIHDKNASGYDKRVALFKCVLSVYALESIRFYVSFVCSFSFVERGLMEGNGKIMTLIARDENLHQGATHYILTRWIKGVDDPMMTEIAKDHRHLIKEVMMDTYYQECAWSDFLFSEGGIQGINSEVLKSYLGWLTNERTKDLGEEVFIEDAPLQNPLPWVDSYLKASSRQVAPQEAEISSYMVGSIDVSDVDLDFEL